MTSKRARPRITSAPNPAAVCAVVALTLRASHRYGGKCSEALLALRALRVEKELRWGEVRGAIDAITTNLERAAAAPITEDLKPPPVRAPSPLLTNLLAVVVRRRARLVTHAPCRHSHPTPPSPPLLCSFSSSHPTTPPRLERTVAGGRCRRRGNLRRCAAPARHPRRRSRVRIPLPCSSSPVVLDR